jgi:diguanylate cyclase (GGDEF)-like protein/PAS domain S-box-containing protein
MSIWSFAYAFVYVHGEDQSIWMKIAAIGWCTFSSFLLHLTLLFTENKILERNIVKVLIYIPSIIFFYISVFLFGKDTGPSVFVQQFFYKGDFIYNFSFLLGSIIMVIVWGYQSNNIRKKKQAKIIVVSALIPFFLNLFTQSVLPTLGIISLPLMGHIYTLILFIGICYAIIKYRLFEISPKLLAEEILQDMMDLAVFVSENGKIVRINHFTETTLGYTCSELNKKHLSEIMESEIVDTILSKTSKTEMDRHSGVYCIGKNGERIPVTLTCSPIIDPHLNDILGYIIVGQDIRLIKRLENEIEEHKKAKDHISYLANHDSLTGLPNRKYFYEILNRAIYSAKSTDKGFAVMFLDLDDLKKVNDKLGHDAGDQLLYEVAQRIKDNMLDSGIAARIGGDEFTLLFFGIQDYQEANMLANRILELISSPAIIAEKMIHVNISIGFSIFPDDGADAELLIKKADSEMYTVKKRKKLSYY